MGNLFLYETALAVGENVDVVCLAALFVLARLLTLCKVKQVRGADAVLTFLLCCLAAGYSVPWCRYLAAAVLVLGIFVVNYWHAYYELLTTAALLAIVIGRLPRMLMPPTCAGILLVGFLLVNHVKRLRGNQPMVYNAVALAGQVLCCLMLIDNDYPGSRLTYFCMLVLGLGVIILTLQERYHLGCRHKVMITELFLSYMIFAARLPKLFWTSILLMLTAVLVGVAGGFIFRQKSGRICGLTLSLLVCCKIVMYDFSGGPVPQRIFLFLAAGALALLIAGIYIVLEKKTQKKS